MHKLWFQFSRCLQPGLSFMAAAQFTVRAESASAMATIRCSSAQDALLTANTYLRLGAACVSIETPGGQSMSPDRFDALINETRGHSGL